MTNFFHTIRQIVNGVRPLDDNIKYPMISYMLAFVHATFIVLFWYMSIMPLVYYNIGVTIFYIVTGRILVRTRHHVQVFIAILIEILFNSVMTTVLLGWDWNFMMYTVGLVPLIFYLMYTLDYFKGKIALPMMSSAIVMVCYYTMRIAGEYIEPVYSIESMDTLKSMVTYYNITLTFLIMYVCSVLFSVEVYYMRRNLEQENRNLGEIANYDPLTHLMNRRSMLPCIRKAFAVSDENDSRFCLIMADIDDFKKVNDTYGHACGDTVLVAVAEVLMGCVREEDCVCRWGGEEFLLLIHASIEDATLVANRICKDIANMVVNHEDMSLSVTMTLGVAEYETGITSRVLIDRADEKLYYGKTHGKNRVVS